jgi:hypothetical protein
MCTDLEDAYTDISVQQIIVSTYLIFSTSIRFFEYLVTNPVPSVPFYVVEVL